MRIATAWLSVTLSFGVLAQGAGVMPAPNLPRGDPAPLIRRLAVDDAPLTSYRAFRTLTADTRGGQVRARLTAWTWLDPIAGFQYSIVDEDGSGVIRQKVLHAALEAERTLHGTKAADKAALTPTNYDFADVMPADEGLVQVGIRPKRADQMLVDGRILFTDPGGDMVCVEGLLSKRPSMWTRDVRIRRQYAHIAGVRVPTAMQSVGRVLLFGRSTFSMVYEYVSINGLALALAPDRAAQLPR
jgi:hypothetical protein